MIDSQLLDAVDKQFPKFNPLLAEGIAVEHLMRKDDFGISNTRKYIDSLFAINKDLFIDGFEYCGNIIASPIKRFEETTREYNSKRFANIAKHDTYMVYLKFRYKGEDLFPRPVLVPWVRSGGWCWLNGAQYTVSPVLADVAFSVTNGTIFIPFRRIKLTFKQIDHHYYCNGERQIMYVIWSMIHKEMSKRTRRDLDNREWIESCLPHYFFCQFGLKQTFKQWGGADVQLGYAKDFDEINYPRDQWNIYQSAKLLNKHPTGDMALAIPKQQETDFVKRLIAGFWYVVDAFPSRFVEPHYFDSADLWRIILGHMVYGDFRHQGEVAENIDKHMLSFNSSLDEMTIDELRHAGINVNNVWELLHVIMTDMAYHFYATDVDERSMYNKRLTILRYLMDEFNYSISMLMYMFQSYPNKDWTPAELNRELKRTFKLNSITKMLTRDHGEFDTLTMPGDSKVLKVTSILIPQDRAKTSKAHNKSLIGDSSRLIHSSLAEIGQFRNHPKNNPDGRGRLNLFAKVRYDGMVERDERFRQDLDAVQAIFNS